MVINGVTSDRAWAQCGSGYVGVTLDVNRPDVFAVFSGTVAEVQALDAVLLVTLRPLRQERRQHVRPMSDLRIDPSAA
jgi:hypothetical protein